MECSLAVWVDYPQQINYDMFLQWLKGDSGMAVCALFRG
jgi:hypothetical protein